MIRISVTVAVALVMASPAQAFEPKSERCFKKTFEQPVYEIEYVKYLDAREEARHDGGEILKVVTIPAVYFRKKTLVREGRYVLDEVSCCTTCGHSK